MPPVWSARAGRDTVAGVQHGRADGRFGSRTGQVICKQGETDMGDKGKKDKGKREQQKKAKLTQKEKRKLKRLNKEKKND